VSLNDHMMWPRRTDQNMPRVKILAELLEFLSSVLDPVKLTQTVVSCQRGTWLGGSNIKKSLR
jgi:hypothetical protein